MLLFIVWHNKLYKSEWEKIKEVAYFILTKGTIPQKDITVLNRYALSTNASTLIKCTLSNIRWKTTYWVGDFNTWFSLIDTISPIKKNMSWETIDLSDIIDKVGHF